MGAIFSSCYSMRFIVKGKSYAVSKPLGEGAFSFVYLTRESSSGNMYALKRTICQTEEVMASIKKEIDVLSKHPHPNILQLIEFEFKKTKNSDVTECFTITPAMERGSLESILIERKPQQQYFSEKEILLLFKGICLGLEQLHNSTLAHNDLKPLNILLSYDWRPVLMDFGSVTSAHRAARSRNDALALQEWCDSNCTPAYRAPELWNIPNEITIDQRSDIWSLGSVLFALCFLEGPFDNAEQSGSVALAVSSGSIPIPKNAETFSTMRLMQLIQDILIVDHTKRLFVGQILQKLEN